MTTEYRLPYRTADGQTNVQVDIPIYRKNSVQTVLTDTGTDRYAQRTTDRHTDLEMQKHTDIWRRSTHRYTQ
jgi:hypothetical protein